MSSEVTPAKDFHLANVNSMDDFYHYNYCRQFGLVVLPWFPVAPGITNKVTISSMDLGECHESIARYISWTSAFIHRAEEIKVKNLSSSGWIDP